MLIGQLAQNIFLYNMGKVASVSIRNALKEHNLTVYHFHNLDPDYLSYVRSRADMMDFTVERMDRNVLRRKLLDEGYGPLVRLVVPFRDPVARLISLIHFSLSYQSVYSDINKKKKSEERVLEVIDFVVRAYEKHKSTELGALYAKLKQMLHANGFTEHTDIYELRWAVDAKLSVHWFDAELRKYCGVDILQGPSFPAHAAVYPYDNALLVKVEKMHLPEAADGIRRFCQLEHPLRISVDNTGDVHGSPDVYARIKQVRLPESFLQSFYSSPAIQHLYAPAEIDGFYARWCK